MASKLCVRVCVCVLSMQLAAISTLSVCYIRKLNHDIIQEMGIKFLIGYEDPYHHRQMTMGEIGCFLSHYTIWQQIVEKQQKEVLILEDDIRFEPYFIDTAKKILKQARQVIEYDLM